MGQKMSSASTNQIGTLKKGAILRAAKAGPFALQGSLLLSLLQMF
jgi:hypothetical protein